jgi:type I restriction enzyme S subunit
MTSNPSNWQIESLDSLINRGIIKLNRGDIISKLDIAAHPGEYPIYSSAKENNGMFGRYGKFMFDEEVITWSIDGGGRLFYREKQKFSVTNVGGIIRILDRSVFDYKFLFYALTNLHSQVIFDWSRKAHPSVIRLVYDKIPIPPLNEQLRIVEILEDHVSRLDVALAEVMQAKLKAAQFRRSLLQSALNGFFSSGSKDEVSGIPKTWRIKTLAEVADWTSGGTPSSKDSTLYGGDIPWIVIGDLTEGIVLDTEKKITQKGLGSSSAKKLPAGTVMVAMYGASIGRTGVMGKEMTTNQAIACGIPKSQEILGRYLLYFLQSQKNEFIAAGKGGAQPNISQGVVKSWQIALPPLEEQLKIIDEIDSQLEHLAQANKATETLIKESRGLKSSLLQAAFTGQLTKEVESV